MATYGNGETAFITENEDGYTNSPEFVAAMYESWYADHDTENPDHPSADAYARTAHRLCEDIEIDEYERTCPYCDHLSPNMDAHENHMNYCAPMDRY